MSKGYKKGLRSEGSSGGIRLGYSEEYGPEQSDLLPD